MQEMSPVGKFHCVVLPDRLYCTRVNGRGRAMREWLDRTTDGLSVMPADGISLPPRKGGTSARPAGPARRLGYINPATRRKEARPLMALEAAARKLGLEVATFEIRQS